MKTKKLVIIAIALLGLLANTAVHAQFKIARSAFGSGGAVSSDGSFRLAGTIGQSAIGVSQNSEHRILSGFWFQKPIDIATSVENHEPQTVPETFSLEQNYPNPFNPSTNISFSILEDGRVSLKIYNLLGQAVATLIDKEMTAGAYEVVFDAQALPSGIYLYRMQAAEFSQVRRLTLVK